MKRRILSILCALALCLGMLPTAAFAAGTGTEKAIQLVADGTAANISGGQADTLYFGNYQQSSDGSGGYNTDPIRWRVLENAEGELFLLSDQNLDVFQYNIANVTVTWATSTIRSWLNGYDASHNIGTGYAGVDYTSDNFISTAFSEGEQAAIAETNVVTADNGSVDGGEDTTDKIFLLSIEQAQTSSFFSDNSSRIATNTAYVAGGGTLDGYMNGVGEANSWWLRSPGIYAENVAYVAEGGSVYSNGGSVDNSDVAVRPAFHLDLNSVLFTSAAAGGKPEGGLQEVTEYSGNEWKLTLLDESRSFSVTDTTASGESGGTVTLQYSGATTGTNEYISVLLTDDQGDALYYGRVVQPQTESGTVNVTIPTGLALGTYTLNVFSEQYNGDYQTDYASAFEAVSLTVTDTTAPTLSNGSATRGDSEAAATVQFTSSEAGTYYYAVVESGAEAPTIDTNGMGAACVSGENTISLDSLTGTGAKDIYIVAKDEAGNVSQSLKIEIPEYTEPVYGISASPTELNFASEPEGYVEAPTAQTVTITNTGNRDITVTLPTSTNYAITVGEGFSNSTAALAPEATATFTVQPKTGLGAGGYPETLTISGSNSVSTSVELSFTVLKSLAGADIQVSGTYTYNGSEQKPNGENVTVTLGDETLNETTDYTLSYSNNINAGTATVTATGIGSYSGTATGTFTIDKAEPTVSDVQVSSPDHIYNSTEISNITLTHGTGDTPGTVALDAGQTLTVGEHSYNWTFTPSNTTNYTTVNGSITLTVAEDAVASIAVTTSPTKTAYTYGESLDTSGMVVIATYASGATKDVTAEVTVSPETLTTSVTALTITYGGKTTTQAITVSPATISIASATVQDKTYDGSEDATVTSVEFTGLVNDESLTSGTDYTATAEFTDKSAGDSKQVTVTVELKNGNYTFANSEKTATANATGTISPLPVVLEWSTQTKFTYDGTEHSVDASISNTVDGDIISLNYDSSTTAATDAGTYTATVSALTGTDAGNYTLDGVQNRSLAWSIGSASIANATVGLSATEFTYNGQSQTPTVTVKLGENTLAANTDYTVTFSGNSTDAGTYTVTVTGTGNYTGTATNTYTITPAALTITGVTLTDKTYDGTNTATVESVAFDGFTLAKGTDYTAAAVYDSADAGTNRTATVTVTLTSGNYTLGSNTYTLTGLTIAQADFGGITGISGTVLANWSGEVTLPAIPNDAKYGTPTSDAVTNMSIADGVLSYTGSSDIKAGNTYTITVPVSDSVNYKDYTITVTLTGSDKAALTITGVQAAAGLVYTGQAQAGYTGTPSAQGYTGDFTVIYNTADQKAPINAGTYTVTIAIPDSDPQYVGSTTLEFVIARKPLTVAAPDLSVYVGSTAPELALVYNGLVTGENVTPSAAPTFVITKSDGSEIALADAVKTAGTYTITWSNADDTTFPDGGNYAITLDNAGTLTVSTRSSGGGSSSSSGTTTETEKNPDGSTTTTVTKPDGSTTETTKYPDGSKEVVETAKDGTVTTTTTDTAGNKTEVVENTDGSSKTTVDNKDGSGSVTLVDENGQVVSEATLSQAAVEAAQEKGEAVALPMPSVPVTTDRETAATVTVDLPSGTSAKVEIPVENVTSGTVAVIVKADGTEEVIKTSLTTENGVAVTLSDGDTVKIVDNSKAFDDVSDGYWAAEMIDFATSRELFAGTSETTFSPNTAMSRAMIVTVLARLDGVDTTTGSAWYEAGQQWAIANGVSDGTNMDQGLSREQLAAMLYRYAQGKGYDTTQGGMAVREYADFEQISDYAIEAMTWAVNTGIISGTSGTTLSPQGPATRAQVATILMRFIETGIQ